MEVCHAWARYRVLWGVVIDGFGRQLAGSTGIAKPIGGPYHYVPAARPARHRDLSRPEQHTGTSSISTFFIF